MPYPNLQVGRTNDNDAAAPIDATAQKLIELSQDNYVYALYLKPPKASTVLRMEYAHSERDAIGGTLAAAVSADSAAPHILEPYAQWQVDKFAKTISAQPDIIVQHLSQRLAKSGQNDLVALLATRYRS